MYGDDLMMMIPIIVITIIYIIIIIIIIITIILYQYHYYYYYHYYYAEPSKRSEFHTSTVSPMALSSITARISSDDLTSCRTIELSQHWKGKERGGSFGEIAATILYNKIA